MSVDTYAVARVALVLVLGSTVGAACNQSDGTGTGLNCGPGTVPDDGQCVVADSGTPNGSDSGPKDTSSIEGDTTSLSDSDPSSEDGISIDTAETDGGSFAVDELEWRERSRVPTDSGTPIFPVGTPFEVSLRATVVGGGTTTDLAGRDIEVETRGEGGIEVVRRRPHRIALFGQQAGTVEVRASLEREKLDGRASTEWIEMRVESRDDWEWDFLARVTQRDRLDNWTPSPHLDYRARSYVQTLPPGGGARAVGLLLIRPKSQGGGNYHGIAIPPVWYDASVSGATESTDGAGGFTAGSSGTVNVQVSYSPPVDAPNLSAQTEITVESMPVHSIEVAWETRRTNAAPLFRRGGGASSAVDAQDVDLDALLQSGDTNEFIMNAARVDLRPESPEARLVLVAHHMPPSDSLSIRKQWSSDSSPDFHHEYHRGYRVYVPASEVSTSSHGASAVSLDSDSLTLSRESAGVRLFGLEAHGKIAAVVANATLSDSQAESASFQGTPPRLKYTSWDECKDVTGTLELEGRQIAFADPIVRPAVRCEADTNATNAPGDYPPMRMCYFDAQKGTWQMCTVYAENSRAEDRWTDSSGFVEFGVLGRTWKIPIELAIGN